ncbi:MAG: hypothetical protein CMB99_00885 [Flavobacteriaceae bacterium]|nr:hypothetical protein [Flavobacteriaceae bacterium]
MATKRNLITDDPRWKPFVARYAHDPVLFAQEVQGIYLSDQQMDLAALVAAPDSRTAVPSGHGCFAKGTEIMLASGDVIPVEEILPGHRVMAANGQSSRRVCELRRGRENMYRFTYNDGTSHVFNESHILCLVATNSKGRRTAGDKITVTVREWLTWGEDKKRCHAIYRSPVRSFDRAEGSLPLPPYILGVWLGDGHASAARVTTADPEIKQALQSFADSTGTLRLKHVAKCGNAETLALSTTKWQDNAFINGLRDAGVFTDKHIPDQYLLAPLADRLELLAGLIDTDGSRDCHGYDFIQKSERLARQVAWLARSVGCHSTLKSTTKVCGNTGASGTYWRVTIGRNTDAIPVRVQRKKINNPNSQRRNLHFGIKSCEPLGEGDYFGFVLDGDHQFLGGDFTVLHNTGKTTSIANLCLWHLLCFFNSNTLLTANDMDQMKVTIWKEIAIAKNRIKRGPHAWIAQHIDILSDGNARIVGYEKEWFIESKTANAQNANKMAGRHADDLLIIVDEASTVPDEVTTTLKGALSSGPGNRMLMTSQPTKTSGFFYDACHKLSIHNGGKWVPLRLSSVDSPWVSDEALKEWWNDYDEDERLVRILGQFPENSSKFMMGRRDAERMYKFDAPIIGEGDEWGWMILTDVALGEGLRDKSACVAVRISGHGEERKVEVMEIPFFTNNIRSNKLPYHIQEAGQSYENVSWGVDAGGIGATTCQQLEDLGIPVHRLLWGNPCFRKRNKQRYLNLRAQAMHQAAMAAKDGRLIIRTNKYKKLLIDQASRIPKDWTGKSLIKVPEKGSRAWEGMKSPDLWDAICFAFIEGLDYMPCSESANDADVSEKEKLDSLVDDALAGVG